MGSKVQPSKGDRSSIRYWRVPVDVQSFKPAKIYSSGDGYTLHSVSHAKEKGSESEVKSSVSRVTTSQLVSAAAGVWGRVAQPEDFQSKASLKYNNYQKENVICIPGNQQKHESTEASASAGTEIVCCDTESASLFSPTATSSFEDLKTLKKVMLLESVNRTINRLLTRSDPYKHIDCVNDFTNKCASNRKDLYGDGRNTCFMAAEKSSLVDLSSAQITENDGRPEVLDSSTGESLKLAENALHPLNPLRATYSLHPCDSTKNATRFLTSASSASHSEYNIEAVVSVDCAPSQQQEETYTCSMVAETSAEVCATEIHHGYESGKGLCQEFVPDEKFLANDHVFIQDKLLKAFSHKRHAVAGALAGTLVSVCLHPVDTVKTVIQSNGMGQRSYYDILRTILAGKGVFGLYRGIASNIASSAPISAIYTYTYESVKGSLLPVLPKEYHSFAHCTAGGCSSIATSFIFTPSDRIKQQMQVGSQYRNCWNALIGCLEKGGVSSLYTGWGAVLCRNIPHSIIKFYTYENLKQWFSRSARPDGSLKTLQTLVCGGLAGSTAALFTTPFDVVKTRLQTQAPGSRSKYTGVLHALQEIAREEGLQGLYRGLPPRLAMYVSQGAIFFASYEFLKALFLLETPTSPTVLVEEKTDTS